YRKQFTAEAQVIAHLDHPNLCTLLDFGDDEVPWLAMSYVDGNSLDKCIPSTGMPVPHALHVWGQILPAIQHAHERGVVHRDLKPSNVLVARTGEIRVTDFGIAKLFQAGSEPSVSTLVRGSAGYMAPEQALYGRASIRSDIFSLGAIAFELIAGRG